MGQDIVQVLDVVVDLPQLPLGFIILHFAHNEDLDLVLLTVGSAVDALTFALLRFTPLTKLAILSFGPHPRLEVVDGPSLWNCSLST